VHGSRLIWNSTLRLHRRVNVTRRPRIALKFGNRTISNTSIQHRTFAVLASLTSPGQFRQHVASRRAYPGFRATGFMNNKVSDRAHSCVAMTHATRRASGLREAYAHAAFSHRMSSLKKRTVLARADGDKSGEDTSDFRERNRC